LDIFSKVATTGAKVPVEFYDQLIARVATLLELDPGKVAKALEIEGSPQEQDNLQQMVGVVDGATSMVANAQAAGNAPVNSSGGTGATSTGTLGKKPFARSVANSRGE
jgi:hypothetical protein